MRELGLVGEEVGRGLVWEYASSMRETERERSLSASRWHGAESL